jgi:hypothetical protein
MSRGMWSRFLGSVRRDSLRVVKSRWCHLALILGLCLTPPVGASDGDGDSINKIEEDWEIIIGEPSEDEILPQLYVVTTPTDNTHGVYSVFEINNLLLPDFYGGGLQLQTWSNNVPTGEAHHEGFKALATSGETITFTVRMRILEGDLRFRVFNGNSTTWGSFGQNYSLWLKVPTDLNDLSSYNPDNSAKFSRVGSGRGRVTQFRLKKVRYYHDNTLKSTDETPRDAQIDEPT